MVEKIYEYKFYIQCSGDSLVEIEQFLIAVAFAVVGALLFANGQ